MDSQDLEQPMRNNLKRLVVFALEDQRYALSLSAVEGVVLAVDITPLLGEIKHTLAQGGRT